MHLTLDTSGVESFYITSNQWFMHTYITYLKCPNISSETKPTNFPDSDRQILQTCHALGLEPGIIFCWKRFSTQKYPNRAILKRTPRLKLPVSLYRQLKPKFVCVTKRNKFEYINIYTYINMNTFEKY